MTLEMVGEPFAYSAADRLAISNALRASRRPVDDISVQDCIQALQASARIYLDCYKTARSLPTRDRISERSRQHAQSIEDVKVGILCARGAPRAIDETSSLEELVERLKLGDLSPVAFEATIAYRFLSSGRLKMEPLPVWLAESGHEHRRTFYENVALCWMDAHGIGLDALQIAENTAGAGGRFLQFVQSVSDPVLRLTCESIGARMTCNIIRDIKREPSPWLQLRLGLIDEYPPRK